MRRPLILAMVLGAVLLGCGGKGPDNQDSTPPPMGSNFTCSDSAPALNHVVLRCGARLAPDLWVLDVVIGSPTESTDIRGFSFNILFDPAYLEYYPNSARAGSFFFQQGAGSTPLVSAALDPGNPGRLVIGIAPTGSGPGFQGLPGYDRIMTLAFKASHGAIFDPQLLKFENAEAEDSSYPVPQAIPSIEFDDQLLLSNQ